MSDLDAADDAISGIIFMRIEHSVGKGGSNRYADVQRIQFMLNVIHLGSASSFHMPFLLAVDGICGSKTKQAILSYQQDKKNGQFPLAVVDGVVTATHHAFFANPRSFGFSTILNLNWDYMQALPQANMAMAWVGGAAEPLYSTVILPLQRAGVL